MTAGGTHRMSFVRRYVMILFFGFCAIGVASSSKPDAPTHLKVTGFDFDTYGAPNMLGLTWQAPSNTLGDAGSRSSVTEYTVTETLTDNTETANGARNSPVPTSISWDLTEDNDDVQEFTFEVEARNSYGTGDASETITCTVARGDYYWGVRSRSWDFRATGTMHVAVDVDGSYPGVQDVEVLAATLAEEMDVDREKVAVLVKPMLSSDNFFDVEFYITSAGNSFRRDDFITAARDLIKTIGNGDLETTLKGQSDFFNGVVGLVNLLPGYRVEEEDGTTSKLLTELEDQTFSVGTEELTWSKARTYCEDLGTGWTLAYGTEPRLLAELMAGSDEPHWFGEKVSYRNCQSAAVGTGEVDETHCGRKYKPICAIHFPPACLEDSNDSSGPMCGDDWDARLIGSLKVTMDVSYPRPGEDQAEVIAAELMEEMDVDSDEVEVYISQYSVTSGGYEAKFYIGEGGRSFRRDNFVTGATGLIKKIQDGDLAIALKENNYFKDLIAVQLRGLTLEDDDGTLTELITELEGQLFSVGTEELSWSRSEDFCKDLGTGWELAYGTEPRLLAELMAGADEPHWFGEKKSSNCQTAAAATGEWGWASCGSAYTPICRLHLYPACMLDDGSDAGPVCSDDWDIRLHGVMDVRMDLHALPGVEHTEAITAALMESLDVDSDEVTVFFNPLFVRANGFDAEFYVSKGGRLFRRDSFVESAIDLIKQLGDGTFASKLMEESSVFNGIESMELASGYEFEEEEGTVVELLSEIDGEYFFHVGDDEMSWSRAETYCEDLGTDWALAYQTPSYVLAELMEDAEEPRWFGKKSSRYRCRAAEEGTGEWEWKACGAQYQPICRKFNAGQLRAMFGKSDEDLTFYFVGAGCFGLVAAVMGTVAYRRKKRGQALLTKE